MQVKGILLNILYADRSIATSQCGVKAGGSYFKA